MTKSTLSIPSIQAQSSTPRIAIVHDYLREYGGAERVLETLHKMYPDAPVYVAFIDREALGRHAARFANWEIHETWMAKLPFIHRLFSPYRIFAPHAFSDLDLSAFDVVITSTNAYFAKNIRVRKGAKQLCYCHTPARSLYGYTTMTDWRSNPITQFVGTLMNHYLRVVDVKSAQKVDQFIANSQTVQQRIEKFYRRDSVVIHPPVHVSKDAPKAGKREYFLYVNRLAFSKHPELAILACNDLHHPLKIVGEGKILPKLKELAGSTITFCGAVSDEQLGELYADASALLYPAEDEDFGMVPIEAMGHGVPVIAHRSGGPTETIIEGKTGVFFDALTVPSIVEALEKFAHQKFSAKEIWEHAQHYSEEVFEKKIKIMVEKNTI